MSPFMGPGTTSVFLWGPALLAVCAQGCGSRHIGHRGKLFVVFMSLVSP